jgi:hypothetical protein
MAVIMLVPYYMPVPVLYTAPGVDETVYDLNTLVT